MACTYTYNGKEYSFNELSLLLKNGLADELYANNVISNPGVYTSQVISTGEDIQVIDSSNLSANVLGNTFSANMYRQAQKIVKSLSKIAPNLSFQFVNSTEEMARIANELGKPSLVNSDAFYAKVNGVGTVYINMPVTTANNRGNVAFHEGLHPLTNALFNAQPELRDQMHSQIVALANDKNLTDEQRAIINEAIQFGKGYTEDGPDVEKNEVIVEFLSKVANQELTFDPKNRSTWNAITDFLNNLAGLLGINLRVGPDNMTANNVVAFANIVGDALRGGETIAFDDIMKQTNENIDNAATYQYPENLEDAIDNSVQESRKIGNMGIVKTANMEEGKYDKLKKAGKIVFNATKNLIKNTPLTITFPDSMMVGKLDMPVVNLDGTTTVKTVSNGSGGVVFVAEFGDVWANGGVESTTANNLAKQINEKIKLSELIYGKGNGKTFLLLGQGSGGKMMSNRESLKGSVTIIENLHRLNVINDDTLKKSLEKALRTTLSTLNSQLSSTKKSIKKIKEETLPEVATKKYEKESDRAKEEKKLARQIQSKEREVIEIQKQLDEQTSIVNDFVDQIKSTEGGALEGVFERLFAENSTFQSRGSAMKTLWMQLYSNAPKGSEQRKAIMESVGVPETVTTQDDFLTVVGENLFEEPILNGVPPKYIYAAIEINNLVEVVPGTHESYPWHIKQIDGAQPTLHFFKDAFDSETIFYNASKGKMVEKAAQIGASQTQISYGNIFVAENKEDIDQIEAMLNKVKEDLGIQESRSINVKEVSNKIQSLPQSKINSLKNALTGNIKAPNKVEKAYKLFRVDPSKPGELFPLFVDANKSVPFGTWIEATAGELKQQADGKKMVKSKLGPLAYRPGWHSGDIPVATHIGGKLNNEDKAPSLRPENQVWAEIEVPNDYNWQTEAEARATRNKNGEIVSRTAHITDQVPTKGFYKYKTNSNMTGSWMISGEMKVNRILSDEEVDQINKNAKASDLKRTEPFNRGKYGFGENGKPIDEKQSDSNLIARAYLEAKKNLDNPSFVNAIENEIGIQESRIKPSSKVVIQGVTVKTPSASEMKSIDAERTSMKWFKDKVNELPSTPASVNNVVFTLQNNVFALVTGQNPEATPMFESDNNKLTEASKKWLKERGYTEYYPVVGRYGVGEESLMVPYMTEQDALDFCNAFKQDSVATNDKILYKDGSYNERDKEQDNFDRSIDEEGADFLSYINANGNKFGFSLGYNFESKYNKQGDKVDEEGNIIEPGASIIQQSYSGGSIISSTPTYQKATIDINNNMVFYTNANMSKVDFSRGNNTHIISVDQKLVYPLAQDPLNIKADNKTDDAILAAANKLGFAVVVNDMSAENGKVDVMTNVSLSPKEIGTAVYPSNNQLIQESRTASIVEVTDPIITGKRNRSVYDSSVPVVEVSKMMNNSIGSVVREYFLPKRGASENIKSRQERINASMATTIDQIVEAANNAEKVINTYVTEQAKAKGITERAVQVFVTGAYNGEYNPATGNQYINELPPAVAAAVRNLRQSTQNLQEVMIKSDTVSPDVALVIKNSINNKGKLYSKRSFAAYEVSPSWIRKKLGLKKKWFANLPENVKTQARDKFIEYALDGSLDEGFALDVANYYKNYVNKLKEMDKAGVSPYDPNYIALADQKAIEEKRLFDEAGKIADEYMDKIERYNDGETTFSLGGKPIKMKDYKARSKAIPQEILDYLGEITDPVEVFRLTAMKLTRMAYSHQMIAQMKDLGMDAGMVLPPGKATPKGWIKLNNIADVDKRTMLKAGKDAIEAKEVEFTNPFGVLKGHSVHPAIYNMIFDTPVQAGLYYKYITSNIKKGKTVFSPVTLIKNWVGYVWFGLANGAVSEAIAFSPTVTRSIKDQYDKVGLVNYLMNVYNDSKKLGLSSSIDADDFRNISDRLAQDKKLMAALANSSNPSETLMQHVMDMTWNGTKKTVEGVSDFFMQAMQLGDAIPKAMMFEIFRNSAAQVVAGTGYYQLSEEDKAKVDETAARRVKRTTVTDQRSIKAADFLQRKFGIFGTFPRFLVESLRNFSNNHLLVVNPGVLTEGVEFSKDPTKDKQVKRALAAKTVIAHVSGLVGYYSLLALVRSGLGFGDDDDDKILAYNNMSTISQIGERMSKQEGTVTQSEALRFFLPDWDKYGNLSAQINKGGTVDYINLSSTDPFNVYHQVARAFVYAENPGAGAKEAAKQVLTPVLDYEIFFDAFKNAMSGVDDKGHRLYTDFDSSPEKAWAGMKYMWKKAAPGIVTTSVRYLEKTQREKKEATAGNAFEYMIKEGVLGRHSQLDVKRELGKIVKDLNKKWTDAVGIQYSEAIKSDSESDYNAAMERRNKNAREFASQVNLAIMNGYALGLSQNDVVEIMAKTRVPKIIGVAALAGGEYITNLKINDLMLRDPSWMSNPNEK
jgi:hypothetical protein